MEDLATSFRDAGGVPWQICQQAIFAGFPVHPIYTGVQSLGEVEKGAYGGMCGELETLLDGPRGVRC
jgi:hypothetical protein